MPANPAGAPLHPPGSATLHRKEAERPERRTPPVGSRSGNTGHSETRSVPLPPPTGAVWESGAVTPVSVCPRRPSPPPPPLPSPTPSRSDGARAPLDALSDALQRALAEAEAERGRTGEALRQVRELELLCAANQHRAQAAEEKASEGEARLARAEAALQRAEEATRAMERDALAQVAEGDALQSSLQTECARLADLAEAAAAARQQAEATLEAERSRWQGESERFDEEKAAMNRFFVQCSQRSDEARAEAGRVSAERETLRRWLELSGGECRRLEERLAETAGREREPEEPRVLLSRDSATAEVAELRERLQVQDSMFGAFATQMREAGVVFAEAAAALGSGRVDMPPTPDAEESAAANARREWEKLLLAAQQLLQVTGATAAPRPTRTLGISLSPAHGISQAHRNEISPPRRPPTSSGVRGFRSPLGDAADRSVSGAFHAR
eukprot:Hpha_TRINITY_DN12692_c0_g2::TRINITY_DN12692_c0_g2_i2::g.49645::m.49645